MKKAPPPEALARYVRWGIMFFLAYALLFGGVFRSHKPVTARNAPPASGTQAVAQDCSKATDPLTSFSLMATSLMPTLVPTITTQDITQGSGQGAMCGQKATFHYALTLPSGSSVYSDFSATEPASATLGDDTMLRGLEQGILGMKPGGERTVEFPPALGFDLVQNPALIHDADKFSLKLGDIKSSVLKARISLVSLSPDAPATSLPLRIIDHQFSSGARVMCGDTVTAELTLWKVDGTPLFSTTDTNKPVTFKVGGSEVPFGIDQAAIGMAEHMERMVIIPASYTKPLISGVAATADNALAGVALPEETLLAQLRMVHISQEQSAAPAPVIKAPVTPANDEPHP